MSKYDLLDFSTSYVTKHIFRIDKKEIRINKIKKY